jgi:hypothetical protein
MSTTDDRPPEHLRDAFLLGYREPGAQLTEHLVRQALAGRAEHQRVARERVARRLASGLAAALAVLVVVTLLAVRLGAGAQHRTVQGSVGTPGTPAAATPSPNPPPASPSAIVYRDPDDPTHLRRVGYDGFLLPGSWTLPAPRSNVHVVSVSPDGRYVVTDGPQSFQIVDAGGQIVSTVASGPGSPLFGVWSPDSSYACQLAIRDPLRWQVVITDVRGGGGPPVVVPVVGLRYPPDISVVACDPASHRAVLVSPVTDVVPAPRSAERKALVVDLTNGRVVQQVSIGDSSHGVAFSADGRYVARIDYDRGTSSIVGLVTGKTVKVVRGEVRGFSADSTRLVENDQFELRNVNAAGTTSIVDWRSGKVLYAQSGWTDTVRSRPGSADLALDVLRAVPPDEPVGPADLVIVPAEGGITVVSSATIY